ncbi:MAG: division plane positioning ATPase MipZ, partial [Alphaproteobacteria bacterium]
MYNSYNTKIDPTKAYIIVVGNEKGGAGKTTSAMHIIASLLTLGFKVGSIDTDTRQLSLTNYINNRKNTALNKNLNLAIPTHFAIKISNNPDINLRAKEEEAEFLSIFNELCNDNDFIVIDTPGSDSDLSRRAHSRADTIITPMNDSLVDMDVLAKVESDTFKIIQPAIYSQMIWEQKMERAKRDQGSINWI